MKRDEKRILMWDVDTQRDFMEPDGKLYVPGSELLYKNLAHLTRTGQERGYFMAGSVDAHIKDDPEFKIFPEHCVIGTDGQKKVDATKVEGTLFIDMPRVSDEFLDMAAAYREAPLMFEKNTTDCRVNENIAPFLERIHPDRIFAYGIVTEICLDRAVRYLTELGYDVYVVEDAMKELDPAAAKQCIGDWERMGVKFTKTYEVGGEE